MGSASAGLIVRAPLQDFTVFAHGLVGGARLGGPNSDTIGNMYHEPYTWAATLTAGGGMDFDLPHLHHKLALRVFEADFRYYHADFGPYNGQVPPAQINLPGVLGGACQP